MSRIDRRQFLGYSAAGAGALLFPFRAWPSAPSPTTDDAHFFLQIVLQGGADPTYLYDARPREMTAANLIQNYNTADALLFTGSNGGTCLLPESSKALRPFLDRFSVVNGAVMNPSFDGHTQNMDFFFTGSSFGGDSFIPSLSAGRGFSIDGVQNGSVYADLANHGNVVPVDPATLKVLQDKLEAGPQIAPGSEVYDYLRSRFAANSAGSGRFAAGAAAMGNGFSQAGLLRDRLLGVQAPDPSRSDEENFIGMLASLFMNRVAGSALWVFSEIFDAHDETTAGNQPKTFGKVCDKLALVFRTLANTPFDAKRSLLDVTTVMVNSEFSRTLRQTGRPIDKTGTDHNQLNNSFLLGGKGIRGGQIIGASDYASASETLTGAHKLLDPTSLKIMGRPFDFTTQRPSGATPEAFDAKLYLTSDSVVNTVLTAFQVPKEKQRALDRFGTMAPTLAALLSGT